MMAIETIKTLVTIEGTAATRKTLQTFRKSVQKRASRQAVAAASTPVLQAVRGGIKKHKRTGMLAKSARKKVKVWPDGNAVAIIGIDAAAGATTAKYGYVEPGKYWHLVDGGTSPHNYRTRKGSHPGSKPANILKTAVESTRAVVKSTLENKLAEVVAREAAKAASKGRGK